ncbi:MAG: hypothetical protein HQM08_24215 [Candidatus Riflebacteria bacterium]|nr:hypothetical protein [Candidatus Riflebacteria bacterium]
MDNKTIDLPVSNIKETGILDFQSENVKFLLKFICLIGFGAIVALGKKLSLPLEIPGHSALLWLGLMIAGRGLVRHEGAGIVIGVSTALWGIPFGLNNSFTYNLGLYGITGVTLDLVLLFPRVKIDSPVGSIICGMLAHMVKFSFIVTSALTSNVARQFLLFGFLKSAFLHLFFGAVAGFLGLTAYMLIRKLFDKVLSKIKAFI